MRKSRLPRSPFDYGNVRLRPISAPQHIDVLARNQSFVQSLGMPTDADRDELELRVSDVAYEVANFSWTDLAARIPIGRTYTRPDAEGPYMSVTWDADWKDRVGGPILIKIQGFLDPSHEKPTWWTGEIIRERGFLDKLLRRPQRETIKLPAGESAGDCSRCGDAIGYHHAGTEEQMLCTVAGCDCLRYDEGMMPASWKYSGYPAVLT